MEVRKSGIATAAVKGARGCARAIAVASGSSLVQEPSDLARLQSNPAAATGQQAEIERYCRTTAGRRADQPSTRSASRAVKTTRTSDPSAKTPNRTSTRLNVAWTSECRMRSTT